MKTFVVVLAFATMVNAAQKSYPYSFDYPYWNQENSLATERFSFNPSVKRQFLQLFGEGVPAAFLFAAAGVSVLAVLVYPKLTEIKNEQIISGIGKLCPLFI